MKTLLVLFLFSQPFSSLAQNQSLEHLWYVENTVANALKKATITLTLDSVSKTAGDKICTEIYHLQKDSTYYTTRCCAPATVQEGLFLSSYASYLAGEWYLSSKNRLILMEPVNKKKIKREFSIQWISDRKVVLTEI